LILGGGGMLGHKLAQVYRDRFETWVTVRSNSSSYERFNLFDGKRTLGGVDVTDFDTVLGAFASAVPEVVINAVGVIKQLPEAKDPITALAINSLFPHRLSALCRATGARLITLGTDCVFSGWRGMYTESDLADAEDLYGRTKFLGETTGPKCLTLRTSIIGRELGSSHSLVEWFLSNRGGKVKGYTKAIYTGFPTIIMADIIADLIEHHPKLSGLFHVSSAPISKYDLLCLIRDAYRVPVEIEPDTEFEIDRSLDSRRFRGATGFTPPSWEAMIAAMSADPTPYDDWRRASVS
jgi:dTDP-4-dehydrorhamnose reductase